MNVIFLAEVEALILRSLDRKEGEATAATIHDDSFVLRGHYTNSAVQDAALNGMVKKGLVEYYSGEADEVTGKRPRIYQITEMGTQALANDGRFTGN